MWTDMEPMNCHREEAFCTILHAGELWQVLDEHLLPCLKVLQQLSVHRRVHGQLLDRRDQRLQLLDARHGPRIYLGTLYWGASSFYYWARGVPNRTLWATTSIEI